MVAGNRYDPHWHADRPHRCEDRGFYGCARCALQLQYEVGERIAMVKHRKTVELNPSTDYWFVEMEELTYLDGGSSYPFPTEEAASLFARNHKLTAKLAYGVDRVVVVRHPDGHVEEI